jgi:hypothetical protein
VLARSVPLLRTVGCEGEKNLPGRAPFIEKKGRDDEQIGNMKGCKGRMPT